MGQLIDDQTASKYYNEIDTATGDDLQSKTVALEAWANNKKAEQRRQEEEHVSKVFTDFDNYSAAEGLDAFDEESRYQYANRKFIANQTGDTPENQMFVYPSKRDEVTDKLFGKTGLSEAETFNLIRDSLTAKKETETALRELPGALAKGMFSKVAEGKTLDETDSWFLFQDWKNRHADKLGKLPEGWESAMLDRAVKLQARSETMMRDLAPESKRAFDTLLAFTRPEDAAALPEAGRADVENIAKEFAKLTPEDRQNIYSTLYYAAEADGAGLGKGFFEKIGEGIARGGVNIYNDAEMTAQDRQARQNLSYFQSLLDQPEQQPDRMQTDDSIQMQRDMAQRGVEENTQRLSELKALREIRQIADGTIDPIKTEMDGILGSITQGAYDFSQSAAYTGMAMVPYVGLPAVMGALTNSNYLRMLDTYPDMDADAALAISGAIAAPQAFIERFQGRALIGKSPVLNALMKKMTDVRIPIAGRLAIGYGANVAFQTGQEFVQEAMPVAADQIAAAIREDMPEFDAGKAWGAYVDQMPEIFYSMLWAGLIGTGASSFGELKRNGQFERSLGELEMVGITGETAQDIAAEQDPKAATAKFQEAWSKRSPEDIQAGIAKRAAQLEAARSQQQNPDLPIRRIEQNPDGTLTHIIERPDGTVLYRTNDSEAADIALIEQTRRVVSNDLLSDTSIVSDLRNQWLAEDPTNVAIESDGITAQEKLEKLQAAGNVAQIEELHRRIATSPYKDTPYEQINILGEATVEDLGEMVFRGVITLNQNSRPEDAREEIHHVAVRKALMKGSVTLDTLRGWLDATETALPDKFPGLIRENENDIVESLARVQRAYEDGTINAEEETRLPASFVDYIKRMLKAFKEVLQRAVALRSAFKDGILPSEYETFLADSVGLNQQARVDTASNRVSTDIITDGGQMLMDFSIGSRTNAVSTDTPSIRASNATISGPANYSIGAFHGTPHKVDKFSTEKIGTGEAAQAFGWGLYFAENITVAENYARGYRPDHLNTPERVAAEALRVWRGNVENAIDDIKANDISGITLTPEMQSSAVDLLKRGERPKSGNLYTVELDVEPEDLLDWDKPLSEQNEKVKGALISAIQQTTPKEIADSYIKDQRATGGTIYTLIAGQNIKQASELLNQLGIPGIRYLDGGSRSDGEGTYNYVVFDENLIRITEENGNRIPASQALAGPATGATNYSIGKKQDADYLAAVEKGDMDTAQRMVDEAERIEAESNFEREYGSKIFGEYPQASKVFKKLDGTLKNSIPLPVAMLQTSANGNKYYVRALMVTDDNGVNYGFYNDRKARTQVIRNSRENFGVWNDPAARNSYLNISEFIAKKAKYPANNAKLTDFAIDWWSTQGDIRPTAKLKDFIDWKFLDDETGEVQVRRGTPTTGWNKAATKAGYQHLPVAKFKDGTEIIINAGDKELFKNPSDLFASLIHEAVHLIQAKEGRLYKSLQGDANYYSNDIEKEARDAAATIPLLDWAENNLGDYIPGKSDINHPHSLPPAATPITRDEQGNVIPLSQRFDQTTGNINYSIASVEHFKNDKRFDKLVKDGRVVIGHDIEEFKGMHILLHSPDNAFAGTIKLTDGEEIEGKGGVYYPALYANKNYFWASTEATVMTTAKHLNEIGQKNGGKILMGLVSAPVEKLFSSTSMATGVVKFLNSLTSNPKAGLSKEDLNSMLVEASKVQFVKKGATPKKFSMTLAKGDGLEKNLSKVDALLEPTKSIFQVRKMFSESLADQLAKHLKTNPESSNYVAGILADAENKHAKSAIKRGTLSKASILQGLGNLFTEPFLRDFQDHGNGKIYAVLEVDGMVDGVASKAHDSYPFTLVPRNKKSKVKLHVLNQAVDWQDVVGRETGEYTTPEERIFLMPTSGMSAKTLKVLGVKGGSKANPLNYSIASQSEIDRVNRALGGMNRGPEGRLAIYERAKQKFAQVLQSNKESLDAIKSATPIDTTPAIDQVESERAARLADLTTEETSEVEKALQDNADTFMPRIEDAPTLAERKRVERDAKDRAKILEQGIRDKYAERKTAIETEANTKRQQIEQSAASRDSASRARMSEKVRRTKLLQAIGELDAILSVLPPEVRGRVGGFAVLANIGTGDKALGDFFVKRIDMIDRQLERTLKEEYGTAFDSLLERTKPKKAAAGEKPKGIGADIQSLFAVVREARNWSAEKVDGHIASIETQIASGNLTAEEEAMLTREADLVSLAGDWKNADSSRRAAALSAATETWAKGMSAFVQKKIREREDRDMARAEAISATGKKGDYVDRRKKDKADNGIKGDGKGWFMDTLAWDGVVNIFFGHESPMAIRLSDGQRKAEYAKIDAVAAKEEAIHDLFTKLAGGKRADGEKLLWQMSQPSIPANGLDLSEMEALSATMLWMQEDGRRHMEGELNENGMPVSKWHYDQKFIDEIESALSPEAKAVRDYLLDAYAKEWFAINSVYRELNGVNLPQIKNYSPVTVRPMNAPSGMVTDPVTGHAISATSISPGALRTRGTAIAEPAFRNVVQTYIAHTRQMEHWKAFAPWIKEVNGILRFRDVQDSIHEAGGEEAIRVLNKFLDAFAQGGNRDASLGLKISEVLNRMASRAAQVALIGRVGTLAIQTTQIGAASAELPMGAYVYRLGKLLTGNLGWGDSLNSAYIQRRLKQMPPIVQIAMEGLKAGKPNQLKHQVEKIGRLISGSDALWTAGTYAMVYDYNLSQAQTLGYTGKAAEDYAHNTAERITDRLAQPTRMGAKSIYEVTATNPGSRLGWAFASEARKNLALLAYTKANRPLKRFGATALGFIVFNLAMGAFIRNAWKDIRDDGDDEDEFFDSKTWNWKRIGVAMATEPLQGIPYLGDYTEKGINAALGQYHQSSDLISFERGVRAIKNIPDIVQGEREMADVLKDIDGMVSLMGLFNQNAAAAASLTHIASDFFGVVENATTED